MAFPDRRCLYAQRSYLVSHVVWNKGPADIPRSFFQMAPAPTRTKRWFRKNGWFTEREEYILCNRAIRDDPSKGDMTNRDPITLPLLWKSLCDFDMWPIYVYGLTWEVSSDAVDRVGISLSGNKAVS
jgi:hypothetical protein